MITYVTLGHLVMSVFWGCYQEVLSLLPMQASEQSDI
jgi:hypothetical protein